MFFLGVGATIIGAAATNIGLSAFQIGLLLAVQNVGFMLAVILAGAVGDTYEKPRILMIGSLVTAASYAVFYRWEPFLLNLLVMFFIGAGTGTYEGVTDAMLLDIHDERQNFYINVNHFFVTFGSLMITLYLVFLQMNWRLSLTQSAIIVLAPRRVLLDGQGGEEGGARRPLVQAGQFPPPPAGRRHPFRRHDLRGKPRVLRQPVS